MIIQLDHELFPIFEDEAEDKVSLKVRRRACTDDVAHWIRDLRFSEEDVGEVWMDGDGEVERGDRERV